MEEKREEAPHDDKKEKDSLIQRTLPLLFAFLAASVVVGVRGLLQHRENVRHYDSILAVGRIVDRLLLASFKKELLPPNGPMEIPEHWEKPESLVVGDDGKSYVVDGWGNPICITRNDGQVYVYSWGPNEIDEKGAEDDIGIDSHLPHPSMQNP